MKIRQPIKPQSDAQAIEPPKKPAMPELAVFILFALMITFFGLVMLYSTSFVTQGSAYFRKQLIWMFIGLFAGAGTILIGSTSTLALTLTNGSALKGTISGEIENSKGTVISTETGTVSVTLDSSSTWTLTADTWITSFDGDPSNVIGNGYTLYVSGMALDGIQ